MYRYLNKIKINLGINFRDLWDWGYLIFDFLLITLVNNFHAYVSIYVALWL